MLSRPILANVLGVRRYNGLGRSYQKSFVLFRAMLTQMPTKRFYLKVDADALLRPHNLLHFLGYLHLHVAPSSPLYFGSAFGVYNVSRGVNDIARAFKFNRGGALEQRSGHDKTKATKVTVRLRDTEAFQAMAREVRRDAFQAFQAVWDGGGAARNEAASNEVTRQVAPMQAAEHAAWLLDRRTRAVTYAIGGAYGFNRHALMLLVRSGCMPRLGVLPCQACTRTVRSQPMHTHEDANVGVCMHILGARLLQCEAFHLLAPLKTYFSQTPLSSWPPNPAQVPAARALMDLVSAIEQLQEGDRGRDRGHTWDVPGFALSALLANVTEAFHDDREAVSAHSPQLSAHPIAVHPIKAGAQTGGLRWYGPLWTALNLRDMAQAAKLRRWRGAHRALQTRTVGSGAHSA